MAERLALPTSDHGVAGSNPAGGKILPEPNGVSCSPSHRLEMTEILLKGCKTLTHPSTVILDSMDVSTSPVLRCVTQDWSKHFCSHVKMLLLISRGLCFGRAPAVFSLVQPGSHNTFCHNLFK